MGGISQPCRLLKNMEGNLISARKRLKKSGILSAPTSVWEILKSTWLEAALENYLVHRKQKDFTAGGFGRRSRVLNGHG